MGAIQIRLVAGVYLLFSAISIAIPLAQVTLYGSPLSPAKFLPAILWTGLVFLLLRGSQKARIVIAVLSVVAAAGCLLSAVLIAMAPGRDFYFIDYIYFVFGGVILAGVAYLLLFSNDLKAEVVRRATREALGRQKYYESLGEQYEE
jgi:hypothetical protein